ncbi:MAG: glycoside hydrolase family 3 N-terminal domain-containing protein, partial [Cyclobacteriaceae bacterium]
MTSFHRRKFILLLFLFFSTLITFSQDYPFQDISLPEDERLDNLISLMTVEEKIDNLSSRLPGVPRLGVQPTRITEGLHGVAYSGPANWAVKGEGEAPTTTFPQAYGLAQMWDPELLEELAAWEAYETRYLAQNPAYGKRGLIMLAPNADLGRDIRWGRTEECYGEDAYLASVMVKAYVNGLQGDDPRYWKTASLMKHFLANSNENNRFINSSDFDERLFREYYSYPFYKGITEAGSRAYMAAYNKYNGIPMTVHPVLEEVTVEEWGQDGIICTDGGAFRLLVSAHKYYPDLVEAAAGCIKAGITMFLDDYKEPLKEAFAQGLITESEIDEAVRGTLRVMLKLGLMDAGDDNPYRLIGTGGEQEPWEKNEARELVREATAKSVVLLKNEDLLPLNTSEIN